MSVRCRKFTARVSIYLAHAFAIGLEIVIKGVARREGRGGVWSHGVVRRSRGVARRGRRGARKGVATRAARRVVEDVGKRGFTDRVSGVSSGWNATASVLPDRAATMHSPSALPFGDDSFGRRANTITSGSCT